MKLYNLKDHSEIVDFKTALQKGLGRHQGLYFFEKIRPLDNPEDLFELDRIERSTLLLNHLIEDEIPIDTLQKIVSNAFTFPSRLVEVTDNQFCLELFHGPTLAFKDFGASFMAHCLQKLNGDRLTTILTATSGDTGAAVAHAFYQMKNIRVVVLFPKNRISENQQKMFTTLGDNIHSIAIDGDFDACQRLVKHSFDNSQLVQSLGLNSANSINIARLLAQVCYYFDAYAELPENKQNNIVISVPCGNFGNICAGIIAKILGLPIKRFIVATNANDTVPRFLQSGNWLPNKTQATMSNAMDVSRPSNWPRIQHIIEAHDFPIDNLSTCVASESETRKALHTLYTKGYLSEPHTAVAYHGLQSSLAQDETGIFLGTAHSAKFVNSVEATLNIKVPLPDAIKRVLKQADLATSLPADYHSLEGYLNQLISDKVI